MSRFRYGRLIGISTSTQMTVIKMPYAVEQYCLCGGWSNTWSVSGPDGKDAPQTFNSAEEARTALDAYFAEIQEEIEEGERDKDDGFDGEEFRIVEVTADGPVPVDA